jgi:DNA-binding beta-propeller fold protein YncE
MKKTERILVLIVLCGAAIVGVGSSASQYRIANRIHVGGEGFWDLLEVDASTGRLFLSHGTVVNVIDTKTGTLIGTIPDMNGVHGIALAPDLKKGFISCGRDSSVVIFDLDSLTVMTRLEATGRNPDAIVYEPFSRRVFDFNPGSRNATVIDAKTNTIVGTVALDGRPELAAVDGRGTLFVNLEDKNMVEVIDAVTLKVKAQWSIAPGDGPTGLAIDIANERLFIGCNNKMMVVMDSDKGTVVGTYPVGERVDGAGFDPVLRRAYCPCGDGTLTVIEETDKDHFKVLENVVTQRGARTLALDPTTHHVYLPTAEFGPAPAPTPENPRPRPAIVPGSFVVLDVAPVK